MPTRGILVDGNYAKLKHSYTDVMKFVQGTYATREFTEHLSDYTKNPEYFINEHHRIIFKRQLGQLYNWLFKAAYTGGRKVVGPGDLIWSELNTAANMSKAVVASLNKLGVKQEASGVFVLPPSGSGRDDRRPEKHHAETSLKQMGLI